MKQLFFRRRLLLKRETLCVSRNSPRQAAGMALAAAALALSATSSAAFFEIARGELILNTTAQTTYDSNIYARNNGESDLYVSLIPELQYLRQAGRGTIDARAGIDFTRFLDLGDEDYEDLFSGLDVTYPVTPTSPLSGGFYVSYTERTEAHYFLNDRVTSKEFLVGADTLYQVSERLGLRNSLTFEDTTVQGFSGVKEIGGTLGLQWVYSEKLSWFADYRLRRSQSSGDNTLQGREIDNIGHAVLFGALGVLRPRINGTVSVGYEQTNAQEAERDTGLIVTSAALEWQWRPRTSLTLAALRDLDLAPTDETVEASEISLTVNHDVDEKISLTGHIGFRHLEFQTSDRRESAFLTGAGIHYIFTPYWHAGLNTDFTYNHSNVKETDYHRQRTRLFTRYSF